MLDPVADRLLLLTAVIALMIDGAVPLAVGIAVLAREALVSAASLVLAAAGAARIDVQWVGKAGTFALMFALPGFLLVDLIEPGATHDVFSVLTWLVTAGGLLLSYYAAARYVPLAGPRSVMGATPAHAPAPRSPHEGRDPRRRRGDPRCGPSPATSRSR